MEACHPDGAPGNNSRIGTLAGALNGLPPTGVSTGTNPEQATVLAEWGYRL